MTEAHSPPPPSPPTIVALVSLGKRGNITSHSEFSGVWRNGEGHPGKARCKDDPECRHFTQAAFNLAGESAVRQQASVVHGVVCIVPASSQGIKGLREGGTDAPINI